MSIIPIPSTRVGDLFIRERLVGQAQADQLSLFKLQNQISTGKRMILPSDDAPAALRAINLQRLLDRKDQIATNISSSNKYLTMADTKLQGVSDTLISLKGEAISVAGNLTDDSARQGLVNNINAAIQTLLSAGNAQLGGRYLFAGSRAQARQLVAHGHFAVNGTATNVPSYSLKPGDRVEVRESRRGREAFKTVKETLRSHQAPEWLSLDAAKLAGSVASIPRRDQMPLDLSEQLVVEYYSR